MKITQGKHRGEEAHPEWNLSTGNDHRTTEYFVPFDFEYESEPHVHVGLVEFVILHGQHHRLSIEVTEIRKDGFTLSYTTWGSTRVSSAGCIWMALGV